MRVVFVCCVVGLCLGAPHEGQDQIVLTHEAPLGDAAMPRYLVDGSHCLDGSTSGFYSDIEQLDSCPTLVFALYGGGACYTESSCDSRAKSSLGSSNYWSSTASPSDFSSRDCTKNPDFCNACHFELFYCTGDVWGGATQGKDTTWNKFYFEGHSNLEAFLTYIHNTWGETKLHNRTTHALIWGPSAGGYGTWVNIDWFARSLQSWNEDGVVVKGAPVAGWFFPGEPQDEEGECPAVVDDYKHFNEGSSGCSFCNAEISTLYNFSSAMSPGCQEDHPNDSFKCSFIHTAYRYLKTPLMFAQYLFDSNQIFEELGCSKTNPYKYVEYFGRALNQSISQIITDNTTQNGLFLASCLEHTQHLTRTQTVNNMTFAEILGDWFWERDDLPHRVSDPCILSHSLPCSSCAKQ